VKTSDLTRIAICALGCWTSAAAGDALLQVDGTASGLNGRPLYLDGTFVGVVGDTVALPGSKHRLTIDLRQGIQAIQEIKVSDGVVTATSADSGDCVVRTYWALKSWPQAAIEKRGAVFVMRLAKPAVAADGECENLPSNLRCAEKAAIVNVQSSPEVGAEIWLDGKSLNAATAAAISVPYCTGSTPRKDFVLRKTGFVNCAASIRLSDVRKDYSVSCTMKSLKVGGSP